MQRAHRATLPERLVQLFGLGQDVWVEALDGVEDGPLLVVGLDAVQVALHQLPAGEVAGLHGVVDVGDGGLDELEVLGVEGGGGREGRQRQTGSGEEDRASEHGTSDGWEFPRPAHHRAAAAAPRSGGARPGRAYLPTRSLSSSWKFWTTTRLAKDASPPPSWTMMKRWSSEETSQLA